MGPDQPLRQQVEHLLLGEFEREAYDASVGQLPAVLALTLARRDREQVGN